MKIMSFLYGVLIVCLIGAGGTWLVSTRALAQPIDFDLLGTETGDPCVDRRLVADIERTPEGLIELVTITGFAPGTLLEVSAVGVGGGLVRSGGEVSADPRIIRVERNDCTVAFYDRGFETPHDWLVRLVLSPEEGVITRGPGARMLRCVEVSASKCLFVDLFLALEEDGALALLSETQKGGELLRIAADNDVIVRFGVFHSADALGGYSEDARAVYLSVFALFFSGREAVATVLAHELQHAADHVLGVEQSCAQNEERAIRAEADVWLELWGGALPEPRNGVQAALNSFAELVQSDPEGLAAYVSGYAERGGCEPRILQGSGTA